MIKGEILFRLFLWNWVMHILYVSDGKAGHRSQALGLYRAIERQSVHKVSFEKFQLNSCH